MSQKIATLSEEIRPKNREKKSKNLLRKSASFSGIALQPEIIFAKNREKNEKKKNKKNKKIKKSASALPDTFQAKNRRFLARILRSKIPETHKILRFSPKISDFWPEIHHNSSHS